MVAVTASPYDEPLAVIHGKVDDLGAWPLHRRGVQASDLSRLAAYRTNSYHRITDRHR